MFSVFTFSHFADAFIQSDLQLEYCIIVLYKLVLENKKKILSLQAISQAFKAMSDSHMWEFVSICPND